MIHGTKLFVIIDMSDFWRQFVAPKKLEEVISSNLAMSEYFIANGWPIASVYSFRQEDGEKFYDGKLPDELDTLLTNYQNIHFIGKDITLGGAQEHGFEALMKYDAQAVPKILNIVVGGLFASSCATNFAYHAHEAGKRILSSKDLTADPSRRAIRKHFDKSPDEFYGQEIIGEIGYLYSSHKALIRSLSN